jgi:hypothetical protein
VLSKTLTRNTRVVINESSKLQELLDASITNPGFCSTYVFIGPSVVLNTTEESSAARSFFAMHGPFIKSLFLDSCNCTGKDLRKILYNHCPQLEELSLVESGIHEGIFPTAELSPSQEGGVEGVLAEPPSLLFNLKCLRVNLSCTRMIRNTKLMADLLKVSPNVERISWIRTSLDEFRYDRNFQLDLERAWCTNLVQYQAKTHETGITIRDTICDVAIHYKDVRLHRLSRIESNMRLSNESIKVLQSRHFPLQFLDISLTIDVDQAVLSSLLQSLSRTLTTLRLEFQSNDAGGRRISNFYDFVFPRMNGMRHLFVQKFSSGFSFASNFCKNRLPELRSLTLSEMDLKAMVDSEEWEDEVSNDSLKILQLTSNLNRFPLSERGISNLAKFFPNLTEIRTEHFDKLDKDTWKMYCRKLTHFGPPSDKGLGGLPCPRSENECFTCCHNNQTAMCSN